LRDTYLTGNPHGWLIFGLFRVDSVHQRSETVIGELDALSVVVVIVLMRAGFKRINMVGAARRQYLMFHGPKKPSISAL